MRTVLDWIKGWLVRRALAELAADMADASGEQVDPPTVPLLEGPKKGRK